MGFLTFAVMAIVVLPIIMLLQKGLGAISSNKQEKEELKNSNKNLGGAWIFFLLIIVVVILYAIITK